MTEDDVEVLALAIERVADSIASDGVSISHALTTSEVGDALRGLACLGSAPELEQIADSLGSIGTVAESIQHVAEQTDRLASANYEIATALAQIAEALGYRE